MNTIVTAEEFCYRVTDGTHDSPGICNQGERFPLITSRHLNNQKLDISRANMISKEDYEIINKRSRVDQWDILFSMIGTVGRCYIERSKNVNYACKNVGIFKFNGRERDAKWLYYYLQSPKCRNQIEALKRGTTQSYVPLNALRNLKIDIPSKEVRDYAIDVLGKFDEKIQVNEDLFQKLEDLANFYVHRSLFSRDRVGVRTKLSQIAYIHQDTFNPKKNIGQIVEHYSIPAFDSEKYPIFESSDNIQSNKNKIENGCVLFSKLNPATKRVWRPLCMTNYAITSSEFVALKPVEGYSSDLIFSIINSDEFNLFICGKASGSTNSRQRIRPSDALLFEFSLPSLEEISLLDKLTRPIYDLQSLLIKQNFSLKEMRDILLPKLISGEIKHKH